MKNKYETMLELLPKDSSLVNYNNFIEVFPGLDYKKDFHFFENQEQEVFKKN